MHPCDLFSQCLGLFSVSTCTSCCCGAVSERPQIRPLWPCECGSPPLAMHLRGVLQDDSFFQILQFVKVPHCFLASPSLVPSGHSFLRRHHCFRERLLPILPVTLALLLCCACAPPVSHASFFFSPDAHVPLHAGRTCSPCLRDDAL